MSWRYWSNAEEGDERKYPFDLLSVTGSIHAPYTRVDLTCEHSPLG
jgi:hypothetical protein